MDFLKKRKIEIILLVVIAILLFSPAQHYIKRLFPSNSIEVSDESQNKLTPESLATQLQGFNTPDITLEDTQGKVTFLHVWGTWCGDCRLEMPYVQQLYDAKKDEMEFVLVDWEKKEAHYARVMEYFNQKNYTMPAYRYKPDELISKQLQVTSFPTTFIINKKGEIVSRHEGATEWMSPEILTQLDKLIQED